MKKVDINEIKEITLSQKARGHRMITINADGEIVVDREPVEGDEQIDEIINTNRPKELFITFWRKDGSHKKGKPKFTPTGQYEVVFGGLSGTEEDEEFMDDGIQDAHIIEESNNSPAPESSAVGPLPSNMKVADFAYMTTKEQLNEAKRNLHTALNKNEQLQKKIIEQDKKILEHENNAERLQQDLQRSKSMPEKMAGLGAVLAGNPQLAQIASNFLTGLIPKNNGAMNGSPHSFSPIAEAVATWMTQVNEPTQQVIWTLLQDAVGIYESGNQGVFDSISNHIKTLKKSTVDLAGTQI